MTQTVILNESASVLLDGSGNGTVKIGPLTARSVWHPDNVHVSANPNPTHEAQCKVYCGDLPIQSNFRDMTVSGSSGDSSDRVNASIIKCGQFVYAVWTGGDPGQYATLIVTGSKEV